MILLAEFDANFVGDLERILENVRPRLEVIRDLRRALEVQTAIVVHPVGVVPILAESDAEQHVVSVVIGALEEVRVVRRDDGQPELIPEIEDPLVELRLAFRLVRLHLEVVAALEQLGVPRRGLASGVESVIHEMLRDFTGQAGRRDDQPFVVLGEQLAVDARLRIKAFGVCERRELDQILVPGHVPREQHQVVVCLRARRGSRLRPPVSWRDVRFHADDRFDLRFLGLLLELPGGVEITVIGDRQRRLLQLLGAFD